MLKLYSSTLKNYYGEYPNNYEINFIHYNIDIINESKKEYDLICTDLKNIKKEISNNLIIYFSYIPNLVKIYNNTNIINEYKEFIYLRIRDNLEYEEYKKTNIQVKIIVELNDLEKINFENKENLIVQINNINELPILKIDNLLKNYNICGVLVGQMAYIVEEYDYLLDVLSKMFNIDKTNQLELEKNNKVTNDIYDIETYKKIVREIENIVDINKEITNIDTFIKTFYYIANNVYYDENGVKETLCENQNLIGAVFDKKSVCEGYSKLLSQVCSLLNIESIIVSGGGAKEEGGHVWNQVLIDGVWYNADVTATSCAIHNNEKWNLCLTTDDKLKYKAKSPFKHICNKNYK